MAYVADRVRDTTTTTGTGTITLANSAPTGYLTFAASFGSGPSLVWYCIDDGAGNWEIGRGLFNGTTSLTRENVTASSNSGNLVNFSSGTKQVFNPAVATLIDDASQAKRFATVNYALFRQGVGL